MVIVRCLTDSGIVGELALIGFPMVRTAVYGVIVRPFCMYVKCTQQAKKGQKDSPFSCVNQDSLRDHLD
jgi:hypothetical protein